MMYTLSGRKTHDGEKTIRIYSEPERENDTYSLSDVEVFYIGQQEFVQADKGTWMYERSRENEGDLFRECSDLKGWYYWFCFPGCMPESDPFGPFETEKSAITDAQNQD